MAKMGLREVDEAIKEGSHPHFTPDEYNTDTRREDLPPPLMSPETTKLAPPYSPGKAGFDPDGSI